MPAEATADPRAWLVFRLGPHLLCASALDVEGIIEPAKPRPVPFSPPYMLGWFDFRGEVAAVISLRTKFGVQSGRDSASGPYVVTRVKRELAAFWVDEVRDVLEAHQVDWQPMPTMPGAAAFDAYTIQGSDVILRTTFEALLRADSVAAFEAAPVVTPTPSEVLAPEPTPEVAALATPEPTQFRGPASAQVSVASAQEPVAESAASAPPAHKPAPMEPERPETAAPVEPERPPKPPPTRPTYSDPLRASRDRERRSADSTGERRRTAAAAPPRRPPAPVPERRREPAPPAYDREEVPLAPPEAPGESASSRGRGLTVAGALLAALLVVGAVLWWAMAPTGEPGATSMASGPISLPAPPATPPQTAAAAAAAPPASAPPAAPATTRVLTVEARDFKLTVDRPVKPQPAPKPGVESRPATSPDGAQRVTYVVARGDTLGHIAHRFLGDAARYPELARLSHIRNPHLIYPGDIVTIDKVRARP